MGIKGFQYFLTRPRNTDKALQLVEVCDQYILIDGSEIMYELFADENYFGRANYLEFRKKVQDFFKNLKICNVKPIVIKDGFKFQYHNEVYAERRAEKIKRLIPLSRKLQTDKHQQSQYKGYFCENVFKQTAKELGIPFFVARHNTDEDLAALSRLLDAPVLASDTVFAAYRLPAGWLPLKDFDWKNIHKRKGRNFITAKRYQIDRFAENFQLQSSVMSLLAIVFDNRSYDVYQRFREEISSKMGRSFDRPFNVGTFLDWYSRHGRSSSNVKDRMLRSLLENLNVDEERERIETQIDGFDYPKLKRDLLEGLQNSIQDPDCLIKLMAALEGIKEEEEEKEPIQREDLLKKTLDGDYPHWALQLLIANDWDKELVHFLPIVISDPVEFEESPQAVGGFIREWSYRILLRETNKQEIAVYDREGEKYKKQTVSFEPYQDEQRLFSSRQSEESMKLKCRDFILDLLIEDAEVADSYKQNLSKLSDDMKLTLAVTICWIRKALPSFDLQKAMAILLTLMQLREKSKQMHLRVMAVVVTIKRMLIEIRPAVDTQVLQWTSQWEVIMEEAINLDQILNSSFPEPMLGKFFSASILEDVFAMLCNNEEQLMDILNKLKSFQNNFDEMSALVFEQDLF